MSLRLHKLLYADLFFTYHAKADLKMQGHVEHSSSEWTAAAIHDCAACVTVCCLLGINGWWEALGLRTQSVHMLPCPRNDQQSRHLVIAVCSYLSQDVKDLHLLTSLHDQLYAAVCFSVINSVEKMFR